MNARLIPDLPDAALLPDAFLAPWFVKFADSFDINSASGCWEWTALVGANGYARISMNGVERYAHRVSCEQFNGPIPDGFQVDHLCGNRRCVNPDHLEAVTRVENILRYTGSLTTCVHGHEYTPANTHLTPKGHRRCLTCRRESDRKRPRRNGAQNG